MERFVLLAKSPLAIVLTSALGIRATTTIFSVVNAVLVRPLPFADPERLMQVAEKNDKLHLPAFARVCLRKELTARESDGLWLGY